MKRLGLAALLAALGSGGWAIHRLGSLDEAHWAQAERAALEVSVEVEGVLRATHATAIGPPLVEGLWDFKIAFLAPEGSEVAEGDLVVAFDESSLVRQLEDRTNEGQQADTELEQRRTRWLRRQQELKLKLAEAEARARKLALATALPAELVAAKEADAKQVDSGLATREVRLARQQAASEESRAQAELASLAERRNRARSRVAQLDQDIERLKVRAPRRGTVLYNQDEGGRPKVGDSVWLGRTVATIPDLSSLEGDGDVDETDFAALVVGQPARLTLDAFPDEPLDAQVTSIGSSLRLKEAGAGEKVVKVRLSLPAVHGGRARPGMRFRGQVIVERVEEVLQLPLEAVRTMAGGPAALRRRWLGTVSTPLKLGRQVGGKVEVLAGLAAGDEVLLP